MKALDTKKIASAKFTYDPNLDDLPIPKIALEKTERAKKFFEEHPLPEHILKK